MCVCMLYEHKRMSVSVSVLGSLPAIVYALICLWSVCQQAEQKETVRQVTLLEGKAYPPRAR